MQVYYCDKCKKKIKKDDDIFDKDSSVHLFGGHEIFDFKKQFHLCVECTRGFSKIVKKFFQSKQ